jgi:integrase
MQTTSLGPILAAELRKEDIIEYCDERRKKVCAATVGGDMTCLTSVLKYAGSAPKWNCAGVSESAIKAAHPFLSKHCLIGKSTPRKRRPTAEEKAALEAHFAKQNHHKRTITDMVKVSRWQHASSRRIGESCALLWRDWNPEKQTIFVRKMKDPKNRVKQKWVALPWDAQDLLYEWAYAMDPRDDEPRILPFNSKTCSQRYTLAKKLLGIVDLHLHDDRRDRGSRLVEEDGHSAEEAIQYTGHDTTDVFEKTYMVLDPAVIAEKGRRASVAQ